MTTPNPTDVGKRIKHRLVDLEMSQSALTDKLGYGRNRHQTVSNWVRGENMPDTLILPALCRALDCSIEWLLTGQQHA